MGGDNLVSLPKWKNYELILRDYRILVYKRPSYKTDFELLNHPNIIILNAPLLEISSTMIRDLIHRGKSVQYLVPEKVFEELSSSKLYH